MAPLDEIHVGLPMALASRSASARRGWSWTKDVADPAAEGVPGDQADGVEADGVEEPARPRRRIRGRSGPAPAVAVPPNPGSDGA